MNSDGLLSVAQACARILTNIPGGGATVDEGPPPGRQTNSPRKQRRGGGPSIERHLPEQAQRKTAQPARGLPSRRAPTMSSPALARSSLPIKTAVLTQLTRRMKMSPSQP